MITKKSVWGGVALLVLGTFCSSSVYADGNVDFSITVQDAALQLTVPSTANLDLTPTSSSADFKFTDLTIKVGTNNATGYTLTMSVPSTDISRTGATSGDPTIGTLAAKEGGYSQNDFIANKWGYKIVGDNYFPITTTLSPEQWITDGPANNVDNTITLASKVNTAIPAGIYKTTLTFEAVANPGIDTTMYNLIYLPNGGTGKMSPVSINYGQSTTIASSTFTPPEGKVFAGWASSAEGDGPYYDAGIAFTAPADATSGNYKFFYAVWKDTSMPDQCVINPDSCGSSGTTSGTTLQRAYELAYIAKGKGMWEETTKGNGVYQEITDGNYQGQGREVRFLIQDMTPEICASATAINSEAYVLDVRDQTSYHIIKAQDGRCWMQDNLALDLTNSTVKQGLSVLNTNVDASALNSLLNGGRISGDSTTDGYATSGISSSYGGYSYSVPMIYTASKDTTFATDSLEVARTWKFGVYYNYCAASAGSYCYGDGTNKGTSYDRPDTDIDAEYDICPSGWRLPTAGGSSYDGESGAIYYAYGSNPESFRIAMHAPLSGRFEFYAGRVNNQTTDGYFWSSTRSGDEYSHCAWLRSYSYYASGYGARWDGRSVRCIAK